MNRKKSLLVILYTLLACLPAAADWRSLFPETVWQEKPRVIVLTDAETDDRCSMVHFLLYTNDMQVDAIIQTNSCFQRKGWSSEPWLAEQLDAYEKVYPNLKVHDAGYPSPDYLRSRVYVGDEDPKGVKKSKRPAVPFMLTIDKQQWQASYADGCAVVRYAPKSAMSEPASNRLRYQLSSDIPTFNGLEGTLVVTDQWPGHTQASTDIPLGSHWFPDVKDPAQRAGSWQGAKTVSRWKPAVLHDWATRWLWLNQ